MSRPTRNMHSIPYTYGIPRCNLLKLLISAHDLIIVFIDEVEGVNRRITDEAGGRVCNPTISLRHRGDK